MQSPAITSTAARAAAIVAAGRLTHPPAMSASSTPTEPTDALRQMAAVFPLMPPAAPFGVPPFRLITTPQEETTECPHCRRKISTGSQIYLCDVCDQECCTACSGTARGLSVVCDNCLDD